MDPDLTNPSPPEKPAESRALMRIHPLRQAAAWAPVVRFPVLLVLVSTGASIAGSGLGIARAAFSGILRGVVAASRYPRCDERYLNVPGGVRAIWQPDFCASCGLPRYRH